MSKQKVEPIDVPEGWLDANPWQRMPDEPDNAWEAFEGYVLQGRYPRSMTALAGQLQVPIRTLYNYFRRWRWHERCEAWEHAIEEAETVGAIQAAPAIGREHARVLSKVRKFCEMHIDRLVHEMEIGMGPGTEVSVHQVMEMLEKAIFHERLLLGMNTDRKELLIKARVDEQRQGPDMTILTDDELERLVEIEDKLAKYEGK